MFKSTMRHMAGFLWISLYSQNSTSNIFSKLWAEKPHSAPVEVLLRNGQTVVPDRFAAALSGQSHGVFAVKEADGNHTLAVVAWNSVVRVLVRGVEKLPKEMSD